MKSNLYQNRALAALAALLIFKSLLLAQAPAISSFSPDNYSPGKTVTLTGNGFNVTAANNVVYFGATKANVTSASATQLVVTVPTGATSKPITVLNTGTGLSASSKKQFTVTNAPYAGQDFAAGSYTAATAYNQTILFRGIAVADFDRDGKGDVVGYSSTLTPVAVSVLRNTSSVSTVSFAAKQDFSLPGSATGRLLCTGDVDNDGKIDIIIGSTSTTVKGLYVFRNTSTGAGNIGFSRADFVADNNLNNVAIGDLDGDGKPEIVASNGSGNVVSVYKNGSTPGTVTLTKTNFAANASGGGVAIGDIDGDGKPDILVADQGGQYLSIFHNTISNGTIDVASFATKVDLDLGTAGFHYTVSLGDLDKDGKLDIVVPQGSVSQVSIFRNTGTPGTINAGSLATRLDLALSSSSFGADIADLDGDGKLDMAVTSGNKTTVFRNKATSGSLIASSFGSAVEFISDAGSGSSPNAIAVADINSDGKPDIVSSLPTSSYSMSIMRGTIGFSLPLQIVSLKAYVKAGGVQVDWVTVDEADVEGYEVERSADGQVYTALRTIAARGSGGMQTYGFVDAQPLTGATHYRIKQTEKNGKITYSNSVRLSKAADGFLSVYPNPATDWFSINSNTAQTIQLRDVSGRLVQTIALAAGTTKVAIGHLPKGIYALQQPNGGSMLLVKE